MHAQYRRATRESKRRAGLDVLIIELGSVQAILPATTDRCVRVLSHGVTPEGRLSAEATAMLEYARESE